MTSTTNPWVGSCSWRCRWRCSSAWSGSWWWLGYRWTGTPLAGVGLFGKNKNSVLKTKILPVRVLDPFLLLFNYLPESLALIFSVSSNWFPIVHPKTYVLNLTQNYRLMGTLCSLGQYHWKSMAFYQWGLLKAFTIDREVILHFSANPSQSYNFLICHWYELLCKTGLLIGRTMLPRTRHFI